MAKNPSEAPSSLRGLRPRWIVLAALVSVGLSGCVQRRMMIRTNVDQPTGALVFIDDYEIGTTPISVDFTYYGTRKIRLVKDGYETLTLMQPIPAPWYEIFPLDFFSENLLPGELRDHRTITYQLRPQMVVPPDELLGRAEALRGRAQASAVPTLPTGRVPPGPAYAPPAVSSPGAIAPQTPLPPGTGGTPVYPLPDGGR
jgi:hypothetical protein